jgi:hypothetical protein
MSNKEMRCLFDLAMDIESYSFDGLDGYQSFILGYL